MSNLETTISASLLPELEGITAHEKWLNCAREYPWYPLPWLMLAKESEKEFIQKANLFFADEQRLHLLLNNIPWQQEKWLQENLTNELENKKYSTEKEEVIQITESDEEDEEAISLGDNNLPNPVFSYDLGKENNNQTGIDETDANNTDYQEPASDNEPDLLIEKEQLQAIGQTQERAISEDNNAPAFTKEPLPTLKEEPVSAQETPEPLAFEPFYSVDYFASQGIKLEANAEPKDKFDRQLKSFTQWLKTMKKVTVQEAAIAADPVVDAQAMQSNSGEVVVTEAMAQVLKKQGKYEKAAAIYQKLILLHPEKSVFFAAQIEDLKNKQ